MLPVLTGHRDGGEAPRAPGLAGLPLCCHFPERGEAFAHPHADVAPHMSLHWGETQGHLGVTGGSREAEDRGGAVHGRESF